MRYVGGKERIATWVVANLMLVKKGCSTYLEPFMGSGAIAQRAVPLFKTSTLSDAHPDLMMLWTAIKDGWIPPTHVTKEEYFKLKKESPSALRGLVGFGSSFSGKWFGGYVDTTWDSHWNRFTKPYMAAAVKSCLKTMEAIRGNDVKLMTCDYSRHSPKAGTLVYCDPPYAGTLGYGSDFDSRLFWATMEQWASQGATVIVSESRAPDGWVPLRSRERKAMLRVAVDEENETRQEVLWRKLE